MATASGEATAMAATGDNFFADGIYWAKESPAWMGLTFLIAGAIFTIFLYKNRPRQMQLTGGIAFGAVLILVLFATLGYYYADRLPEGADAHLALGSAFPLIAVPLLILAYRAIKKTKHWCVRRIGCGEIIPGTLFRGRMISPGTAFRGKNLH
ncbi:MAG: DUF4293 family protein [Lewinellaceae bacterium]|nr:DUF4293 family protein [Lewinellaceae bacterium]